MGSIMLPIVEAIVALLGVAGILMVLVAGAKELMRRVRRLLLPAIVREKWTADEVEYRSKRERERDQRDSGSLLWQMHLELERLTTNAASMITNRKTWHDQLDLLARQAADCTEQARLALACGQEDQARQALGERESLEARRAEIQTDVTRLDAVLAKCRRDMAELENRIADDLRRSTVAESRLTAARDSIRARQLVYGTLTEAAMARAERTEQEADLAEGAADALALGRGSYLDREFAKLEQDAALEEARRARS
jgi:phage shock protein A